MYIDGEFVPSKETIAVINPADKQTVSYIPKGTKEDVQNAVDAASRA
jgi:lactaldehyde dehydrogenase/glycolaldehyde dehydrogenase